jgi:hypothetical protein
VKAFAALVLIACSSPQKPIEQRTTARPVANATLHTCAEAAAGLERGTRGLRTPESSVLEQMQGLCTDENWPTPAIDCFAALGAEDKRDELGACVRKLPEASRIKLFAQLDGSAMAIVDARLASLSVGIAECDRFVATVRSVLGCSAMPLDRRVQLGAETADFWSLPTSNLPADAQKRMAAVCGQSLAALQQQAAGAGCMP